MTINTPYGKITASKETLNDLAIVFFEASKSFKERNNNYFSDKASDCFDIICDELEKKNYYN